MKIESSFSMVLVCNYCFKLLTGNRKCLVNGYNNLPSTFAIAEESTATDGKITKNL